MDKIDRLEKRIQELENFIQLMKSNNDDHNKEVKIWRNLIPDQDGFEENFLKKYSKEAYQEKGLSDSFHVLDFSDAIEKEKSNDAVKRLHYWMDFQKKMISIIGLHEYSEGEYWQELRFFVKQFIEYYQDEIVERILKKGKHFEGSGRSEDIREKEIGLKVYQNYKKKHWGDPNYFYVKGKNTGKAIRKVIDPLIREAINEKRDEDDKKISSLRTIWDYIRENESEMK